MRRGDWSKQVHRTDGMILWEGKEFCRCLKIRLSTRRLEVGVYTKPKYIKIKVTKVTKLHGRVVTVVRLVTVVSTSA